VGSTEIVHHSRRSDKEFQISGEYQSAGDQPQAIEAMVQNINADLKHQVLLGVTGSGKTFSMANAIARTGLPSLILAPNKTLAAQMYAEFKELFPRNAVEYFVSYYDYYQPESYVPSRDLYIEKDSAINEQIDRMRHSATRSLLERNDVIIVSSVSCIYGLGSTDMYSSLTMHVKVNDEIKRDQLLRDLVLLQYSRSDIDFSRTNFRVRGDTVEIFPPFEDEKVMRLEFFGDYIDRISWVDPLRKKVIENVPEVTIYPASHYVSTKERTEQAIKSIQEELRYRLQELESQGKVAEAQRLEQRTYLDIEMIEQMGFCSGIENYSRHFTGHLPGQPPPTLIEYFPESFLCFIDESHLTIPQLGAMYRGDRARKMNLVEHGFRLPSALDNRPLNFQEFERSIDKAIYVSATPGEYEMKKSEGLVIEQIIRPTGLLDPVVEVRPVDKQVDDILNEVKLRLEKNERVLITTLTKKTAEDLSEYYESIGIKVKYLHSDIDTLERTQIIRDLRLGVFDVLIGINLLREGLDIPEVSLVAITDADKEGFLRSTRSLIQTIGRAARNAEGRVILYANRVTDSMEAAIKETARRRAKQEEFNKEHGITPQTIRKKVHESLEKIFSGEASEIPVSEKPSFILGDMNLKDMPKLKDLEKKIKNLKKRMKKASDALEFEEAASLRDEIKRLELLELSLKER
tara:strand:- start:1560 stop:3623 length:2064 start_codon:yes stop_codon:yes gene_type:complete